MRSRSRAAGSPRMCACISECRCAVTRKAYEEGVELGAFELRVVGCEPLLRMACTDILDR